MKELLACRHKLQPDQKGEFRVLVLSDIHAKNRELDSETKENIRILLDRERPDLVLLDGDNTWKIHDEELLHECIGSVVGEMECRRIPWAHTFGNHDCERDNIPKIRQQAIYESFDYCLSKAGDPTLPGVGNYVLPVYDGQRIAFAIWVLDSGDYIDPDLIKTALPVRTFFEGNPGSCYAYIQPEQIAWYQQTSRRLQEYNGGKPVPGIMAFHIPLQEFYFAWENREALPHTGQRREGVCASLINSGMFAALRARGDVQAVVCGHDHVNDYMVDFGGIKLCYAATPTNEEIYHDDDLIGGRVFVLRPNERVETYMSYIER